MPVLYRGIALKPETAEDDCQAVRENGTLAAGSSWKNTMASPMEVRSRLDDLVTNPLHVCATIDDLSQRPITHVCGDFDGAARYALSGTGIPMVISVEWNLEDIAIDGRDFLYTIFQLWDREGCSHRDRVRGIFLTYLVQRCSFGSIGPAKKVILSRVWDGAI